MITGMPRIAIAVKDFDEVIKTFQEKLGMPVFDLSSGSIDSLGAKIALCAPRGGSNIEIMSPANPDAPLSQSVQRFIDRRGEGHFALMLEAIDPDAEADELSSRGLNAMPRMAGAGGRDIHPNSTHGVLIRVYPVNSIAGLLPARQLNEVKASTLTGIQRVVIAVLDINQAMATYGEKFAIQVAEPAEDRSRGTCSVVCTPPTGGVIELVAVNDASKTFARSIEDFLTTKGEGIYALVLHSGELMETVSTLADADIETRPVPGYESARELDSGAMSGARFWIT